MSALAAVPNQKKQYKLVTHQNPDTDAFLCLWGALKFVVEKDNWCVSFIPASETLSEEDAEGYEVLVMDTGGGPLDQHGKELERSSSFELFCRHYGLMENQSLQPLIELSQATDNVEKVSFTDVHYILKGLAHYYRDSENKAAGWEKACDFAFALFDILYGQAGSREVSKREFAKLGDVIEEIDGIKFCFLPDKANLREEAFNAGADVVMWTSIKDRKNGRFYTGIQVSRNSSLTLAPVIEGIRAAEGRKRKVNIVGRRDLGDIGENHEFGGWFLHDSKNLIVCGSRSKDIVKYDDYPTLTAKEIADIVRGRLPWTRWKKQAE